MAGTDAAPPRLRITTRSALLSIGLLGATLALLQVVSASQRVLGWIAAAAALAGLLHPAVSVLARRVPRGLAAVLVAAGVLGFVGGVGFSVASDVAEQTRRVQRVLPQEADRLERSERFGQAARRLQVGARTQRFVDDLPERLRGGSTAEALQSAASRGVAYLATSVLALFFLLHGPLIARAARDQITDVDRRRRASRVAVTAYRRTVRYAHGTLGMAAASGVVAYILAAAAGVPGPAPLALWLALWDVVPMIGVAIGALPLIVLAAAHSPLEAAGLAAFFLAYQALETAVAQPWVERRSLRLGPFLTVVAGLVGLELYGIGGIILVPLTLTFATAVADELTRG